jgi:Tol biopolymer transport system component
MDTEPGGAATPPDGPRSTTQKVESTDSGSSSRRFVLGLLCGVVGGVILVMLGDLLSAASGSDSAAFEAFLESPVVFFLLIGAAIGIGSAFATRGAAGFLGLFVGGFPGVVVGAAIVGGGFWLVLFGLLLPLALLPGYPIGRGVDVLLRDPHRLSRTARRGIRGAVVAAPLVLVAVIGVGAQTAVDARRQGSCPTVEPAPDMSGRMAFVVPDGTGFYTSAVCVVDVSTGEPLFMFEGDTATDRRFGTPSWAPDGSAFVVEATTEGQSNTVIVVPLDGSPTTTLTPPDGAWSVREPDWSPDGRRIAAVYDEPGCGGCGRLAFYDVSTGEWALPLTTLPEGIGEPDWSPDGEQLIVRGVGDISLAPAVIIDEDGIVSGQATDDMSGLTGNAAWSPTGDRIAVPRRTLDDPDEYLWIMAPDGSDRRQLTFTGSSGHPAWSPDGGWLAFNWYDDETVAGPSQIWVVDADGGDPRLLVDGGINAAWAP